jgi:hypothetical protein
MAVSRREVAASRDARIRSGTVWPRRAPPTSRCLKRARAEQDTDGLVSASGTTLFPGLKKPLFRNSWRAEAESLAFHAE